MVSTDDKLKSKSNVLVQVYEEWPIQNSKQIIGKILFEELFRHSSGLILEVESG